MGLLFGPLFFNIFLNYLLLAYLTSIVCNFTDDNTRYCYRKPTDNVLENF